MVKRQVNLNFHVAGILPIVISLSLALAPLASSAQDRRQNQIGISKADQAVLDKISANSMRGHLSFIASDLLEGRDSPSQGLDIAAEYIAEQFRRAGLEPIGDDGYFQTAELIEISQQPEAFSLKVRSQGSDVDVSSDQVSTFTEKPVQISGTKLYKLDAEDPSAFASIASDQVAGQAMITELPLAGWERLRDRLSALKPSLIIRVDRQMIKGTAVARRRLISLEKLRLEQPLSDVPYLVINNPDVIEIFDAMKPGLTNATLSMHAQATSEKPVKMRNVVGLLRGSDPALKETYVLVTAHYDHLGVDSRGRIYNGANDNASGAVSVIELASALSTRTTRPKRSLVFMTFFGEEKGKIGSEYYVQHPLAPLEKTIANVNLEQLGRTDSVEGPQITSATVTGFDFSDITATFQAAGKLTGIRMYKHELFSDRFFLRSDNGPFAQAGIPAHTIGVLFQYPDYHGVGDKSNKIDYDNMARVNRMLALGLIKLANASTTPKWNENNGQAAPYVEAWKRRHQSINRQRTS